jgi:hypothetical protein
MAAPSAAFACLLETCGAWMGQQLRAVRHGRAAPGAWLTLLPCLPPPPPRRAASRSASGSRRPRRSSNAASSTPSSGRSTRWGPAARRGLRSASLARRRTPTWGASNALPTPLALATAADARARAAPLWRARQEAGGWLGPALACLLACLCLQPAARACERACGGLGARCCSCWPALSPPNPRRCAGHEQQAGSLRDVRPEAGGLRRPLWWAAGPVHPSLRQPSRHARHAAAAQGPPPPPACPALPALLCAPGTLALAPTP